MPEYTGNIDGLGTTRLLEAIRKNNPSTKFYQASTSEMFGAVKPPQNEQTPFEPASPYACAKVYAYWMTRSYREAYKMYTANGILFNRESPRRGDNFVTRKITLAVANILAGNQKYLDLGNVNAKIDWGFAPEYVEMMWLMLKQVKGNDFVIGTGETHTIQDFIDIAFDYAGLQQDIIIRLDKSLIRPKDDKVLKADITNAKNKLAWKPKITLSNLVKIMIDADMRKVGLTAKGSGDMALQRAFTDKWWSGD
jgi:GDPmannose 4,6-dehydratase